MSNLVIDLGTTNLKIVLFEGTNVMEEYNKPYETTNFKNEKVIDVNKLNACIDEFINKIDYKFSCVYVYSFAEGGIFLDKNNFQITSPLFFWNNSIGVEIMNNNIKTLKPLFEENGIQMKPKYSIFRIVDFINKGIVERENFIWLNAADYVCFYLTNEIFTNKSLAIRTGTFDVKKNSYSKKMLDLFNLDSSNFAVVKDKVIKNNITIINCGHDHLNLLNITNNKPIISTGTTQVVLQPIDKNMISGLYHEGFHIIYHNNETYAMGSIEDSGSRIDRFIVKKFKNMSYEEIIKGCLENPNNHLNKEFLKLLDEIALEVSSKIIGNFEEIYITGGLSKNKIYMQKLSNICNSKICVLDSTYTTMYAAQNIALLNVINIYQPQ